MDITLLKGEYSIYRFTIDSPIPDWVYDSDFYSVTKTKDEMSIISKNIDTVPDVDYKTDRHWRILKLNGPLDLSLVGIIADITGLFKINEIPVFIISTYDTDYILVKPQHLDKATVALNNARHRIYIEK